MKQLIGNAIWVYIWAMERVTKSVIEEGETYGVVKNGAIITYGEIAHQLSMTERTVHSHISLLKKLGIVFIQRKPHGVVLTIKITEHFTSSIEEKRPFSDEEKKTECNREESTPQIADENKQKSSVFSGELVEKEEKKLAYINYAFYQAIGKTGKLDAEDTECAKRLLRRGVTEQQIIAGVTEKIAWIRQKQPNKQIRTLRYFEKYLLEKWDMHRVVKGPADKASYQQKYEQWEAEPLHQAALQELVKGVKLHVRSN